jgi:hypothetical protein
MNFLVQQQYDVGLFMQLYGRKLFGGKTISGQVGTSPYLEKYGKSGLSWDRFESAVSHELGHACEFVTSQLMLNSKDQKQRENAGLYLLRGYDGNYYCTEDQRIQDHFKELYRGLTGDVKVAECLSKISTYQLVKGAFPPCNGYCVTASYKETYAQTFELLSRIKVGTPVMLYWGCKGARDSSHPANVDITECLVVNSSQVRSKMKKDLCGAK